MLDILPCLQSISPLARRAAEIVVLAVDDDGLETLISELQRGLGDTQVCWLIPKYLTVV